MSSFEFHDHNDNEVIVSPVAAPEGPAVWLYARQGHTSTNVIIPLDRVEEVVAGLRDMARQAGGQPAAHPAEPQPNDALPQLLATTLTERFTALGNPFSRMSINFKGPDGWPATRDASPNDVADVLRELLAQAGGPAPALPGAPITVEQLARAREGLPEGAVITAAALRAAEPLCGHGECNPTECFEVAS